ncbi:MAG: serine/threonine protein kinase [Gracilimonas sp.]|uniref:serine/threonine-protein kinase n=1 Tax=Gracilimonas sp. TaxID=1974203 RepID=UPI0019BF7A20|nr:serine/threonine-protein kinase [Gracilimonas sp.]MBD3615194.1 serine/threonine protein kinase [Gracilimonas sp.]
MSESKWKKIEYIIDHVLDLKKKDRNSFIEQTCGDDPNLKNEVYQLLESISDSEGWLEDPETFKEGLFEDLSEDIKQISAQQSLIGTTLGSYTIKEQIGEGGMGAIYLAERSDGEFKHQVAVKIIRNGRGTKENIKRFKREQRILARLNHPGIAHLYDGGVTNDGFPYIIMEYVDGMPITEYCIIHRCTINQKIALFKQVLEALRNAHENLTIHRDLKPDNILIDQSGNVKILDFGISKLLLDDEDTILTKTGSRLLTPRYAAPEQIRQENITTATDLYALGVVLYKLLTDSDPIDLDDLTQYQVEQAIISEEPSKPSNKVSDPKLKKQLQGDLDAIVLKSIRKEPDSRYRVANDFLKDLNNFQEGLPVSAQEDSFRYRSLKFIKRNKQGISIAAGILILIVSFTGFYTNRITQERNTAQLEAEKSEEISSFVIGLLEQNYPENSRGDTITVRHILDKSIRDIQDIDKDPQVRAKLLQVIGHAYNTVGEPRKAKPILDQSIQILEEAGAKHTDLAHTYNVMGVITRDLGKLDSSKIYLQKAVNMFREVEETNMPEYPKALKNLAYVLRLNSEYEQASVLIEEALNIEYKIYEVPDVNIAESVYILASIHRYLGNYQDALEYQFTSLEMLEAMIQGPHPGIVANLSNIGTLYKILDRKTDSKKHYKKALAMAENLYGPNHPEVANLSSNISSIYIEEHKFDSAKTLIDRSVAITGNISGMKSSKYAHHLRKYGTLYYQKGEYIKADSIYSAVLNIFQSSYKPNHPEIASAKTNMAKAALAQNEHEKAQVLLKESLSIRQRNFPNDHPLIQSNIHNLIDVLRQINLNTEADSFQNLLLPEDKIVAEI